MTDRPRSRRDVVRDLIPPEVLADLDEDQARESRAAVASRMPPPTAESPTAQAQDATRGDLQEDV